MTRTILLLGDGPLVQYAVDSAHRMGHAAEVLTNSASLSSQEEILRHGDPEDIAQVVDVAQQVEAAAVFPLVPETLPTALAASEALGFEMAGLTLLRRLSEKGTLRQELARADIPMQPFQLIESIEEGERAARELGVPLLVRPAQWARNMSPRLLQYPEDLPLAYRQVQRQVSSNTLILEPFPRGIEYGVDLTIREGVLQEAVVSRMVRDTEAPQVTIAVCLPAESAQRDDLVEMAVRALRALDCFHGVAHVDLIRQSDSSLHVADVRPTWDSPVALLRLIQMAHGIDFLADALRGGLGEPPREHVSRTRGAAIAWLTSQSGVVESILGEETARATPGVEQIAIGVQVGDVLGHVVDHVSRDRLGYVMALADTAETALDTAYEARSSIRIVTRPTRE